MLFLTMTEFFKITCFEMFTAMLIRITVFWKIRLRELLIIL